MQFNSFFTIIINLFILDKPSFHNAMKANESKEMYSTFLNRLKQEYVEERIKGNLFQFV